MNRTSILMALFLLSGCELLDVSAETMKTMGRWNPGENQSARRTDRPTQTVEERDRNAAARSHMENILTPDRLMSAQLMLNSLGYECGEPTGVIGGQTRIAVIDYQSDHQLEVTGWIDDPLIAHLEKRVASH